MPSAAEWDAKGYSSYGLIAVSAAPSGATTTAAGGGAGAGSGAGAVGAVHGEGVQIEKVSRDEALALLSECGLFSAGGSGGDGGSATDEAEEVGGAGLRIAAVGPSLGSFSVSSALLGALLGELRRELEGKKACMDSDPHFWMPLTLPGTGTGCALVYQANEHKLLRHGCGSS